MENTWLGYVLSVVLGSGSGAMVQHFVVGRRQAKQIGAQTAAIEQKTGPEVDSIYLDNAGAALDMQLKVNASQAAEIERLSGLLRQKDEHIVLLETSLKNMTDRLDAAEFSLKSARAEGERLAAQLARYREDSPSPPESA